MKSFFYSILEILKGKDCKKRLYVDVKCCSFRFVWIGKCIHTCMELIPESATFVFEASILYKSEK